MRESQIVREIKLGLSSEKSFVLRTNAGAFWQGSRVYSKEHKQYVLKDLRKVDGLPAGFPDLIAIGDNGKIAFIETKTSTGKARKEQLKFISRVKSLGHRAGIARSIEDARRIFEGCDDNHSL